jgi:aryl-alcohol dehydrogenase-like predicted oxidoreductase
LAITFIDTADAYGPEVNERLSSGALHPYPQGLVIATKGGHLRPGPWRWQADCRPERLLLHIRIAPEEKVALAARARAAGYDSLSAFVRARAPNGPEREDTRK